MPEATIMTAEQAVPERTRNARAVMLLVVIAMDALYLIQAHAVSGSPHRTGVGWPLAAPAPAAAAALAAGSLAALAALWFYALRRLGADRRVLYGGALLFGLTLMMAPATGSSALFDDMGHGRVLAHYGANPYLTPASTFPPDHVLGAMGRSGTTPLAGPAWISLASLVSLAGGGRFAATVLGFKLLLLIAHMLNGALIAALASRWKNRPEALAPGVAAAFYLWNPLVLTQAVGEGHHHVVALTWLLLAFWLAQRGDESLGWGSAAMACLVDYMMLPVAALFVVQRWRRGERAGVVGGAGLAAAVFVVAYLPYLKGFQPAQLLPPWWLPDEPAGPRAVYEWLVRLVVSDAWFFTAAGILWGALALLLAIWWARAAARLEALPDAAGRGAAFVLAALLIGAAAFETGAIGWPVALAAVAGGVALRSAAALLSVCAIALQAQGLYRVLIGAPPRALFGALLVVSLVAVVPPSLYLVLHFRGRRASGPRGVEESA